MKDVACREPALSLLLLLPLPLSPPLLLLAQRPGLSIPCSGYPAPRRLPRPGPTPTSQLQGTKAEPACPLLQPEDESRGLSGECGLWRLEGRRRCCARRPRGKRLGWACRAGAAAGPIYPDGVSWTGEVVVRNAAPALPAHRRTRAALPQSRGKPPGGNWRQREKSLEPEAGQRWLRKSWPQHLAARGWQGKAGGRRLQCAQSFGWRAKAQARATAQSRSSCGRSRKGTFGGRTRSRRDWDKWLLLAPRQPGLG